MKYLKKINTESDYKTYRDGEGYLKPNVSLTIDTKNVFYNLNNNEHPYVDLGLPSGTLWATMNVGASKPSDAGLYFQWGDTQGYTADQVGTGDGKKKFSSDWCDYKWGTDPDFSKYTSPGAKLELEDDAAHANMGGNWHMPTDKQIQELINTANTTSAWTTNEGVSGVTFTSKKDVSKSIFIPAAGMSSNGSVRYSGEDGYVGSSMLFNGIARLGQYLHFGSGNTNLAIANREVGLSVRGVIG